MRSGVEFPLPQSDPAQAEMRLDVVWIDRQRLSHRPAAHPASGASADTNLGGLQEAGPGRSSCASVTPFESGKGFRIALLRHQHLRPEKVAPVADVAAAIQVIHDAPHLIDAVPSAWHETNSRTAKRWSSGSAA